MMKKFTAAATVVLFLVACQSGQNDTDTGEAEVETAAVEQAPQEARRRYQRRERERPAERESKAAAQMARQSKQLYPQHVEALLDQEGVGLTMMIDASNADAFRDSLELIASDTSQEQYYSLLGALKMIQAYDMGAARGEAEFLAMIDGLTGEEIVERASRLRSPQ